jgi:excisionase family DNA binding protein
VSDELLIDLDEAGRRLAQCRRSIQSLIHNGSLPSVRIGRSRRIAVADLLEYVDSLRQENDREEQTLAVVGEGHHHGLRHRG